MHAQEPNVSTLSLIFLDKINFLSSTERIEVKKSCWYDNEAVAIIHVERPFIELKLVNFTYE